MHTIQSTGLGPNAVPGSWKIQNGSFNGERDKSLFCFAWIAQDDSFASAMRGFMSITNG
jgi:hypothetical protein